MDALLIILLAVLALGVGVALGWYVQAGRTSAALAAADGRATGAEALLVELRGQLDAARAAERAQSERREKDTEVLQALAPVRETLGRMQQHITELERERSTQYGALSTQLRHAHEQSEELRRTTESLAGALRSNDTRGVWGETALRRIVESAGMTRHVDFFTQASVSSDAGAGRPDMVIRLPGSKYLPVDAKVPLDAYLEASVIPLTAPPADQERRAVLLQRHVRAVRAHVDALSKKAYWAGLDSSPEFVVCFLPNESLLGTALDEDPALLDYAFSRRVALASPVNLWAVLKTVAYTWTQQDVSDEARALFDLGNTLYERLGALSGHADALRKAISRTVDSYNKLVGSLESRVLVTARRFPGIDETKLEALAAPESIDSAPRGLTAPELTEHSPSSADAALAEERESP